MTENSVLPKSVSEKLNLNQGLESEEETVAINALKYYCPLIEANTMLSMVPVPLFNSNYPNIYYLFGNYEEYQAHTSGYRFRLKQIDKLKSNKRVNQERKELENSLKFMEWGRKLYKIVEEVNQLPRNIDIQRRRIELIPQYIAQMGEVSQLASAVEGEKIPSKVKESAEKQVALAKELYRISDPEILFQPSQKREYLLKEARELVEKMGEIANGTAIHSIPRCIFSSDEDWEEYKSDEGADASRLYFLAQLGFQDKPEHLQKFILDVYDDIFEEDIHDSYKSCF